jgi:hypothetical protein
MSRPAHGPAADVEAAWAEEAHRRWEAYLRGEEEMLDFDEVMSEMRQVAALASSSVRPEPSSLRSDGPNLRGRMALTVEQLESELRSQPREVQNYLAEVLLDTLDDADVDDDAIEAEAHRRAMEMVSGEVEGVDADEVIAQLRARRRR